MDRAGCGFSGKKPAVSCPITGQDCLSLGPLPCPLLPGPAVVVGSVQMDSTGAFSLQCCFCETHCSLGQGAREVWGYFLLSAGSCPAAVLGQISCGGFSALLLPHATDLHLEVGVVGAVVVSLCGGCRMVFLSLSQEYLLLFICLLFPSCYATSL